MIEIIRGIERNGKLHGQLIIDRVVESLQVRAVSEHSDSGGSYAN